MQTEIKPAEEIRVRAKPNRILTVKPGRVEWFEVQLLTGTSWFYLKIRDDDQGGVVFRFPTYAVAEAFCDRLVAHIVAETAPPCPPSLWSRFTAWLKGLFS